MTRRHGFFVHANTDFGSIGKTNGSCSKDGSIGGTNEEPYYSGKTANSHYTVTAGAIHRLTKGVCLFEGVGYGRSAVAWHSCHSVASPCLHPLSPLPESNGRDALEWE